MDQSTTPENLSVQDSAENEKQTQALLVYAAELKQAGSSNLHIRKSLEAKGLNKDEALQILDYVNGMHEAANQVSTSSDDDEGSGVGRIAIYIGILLLVNLLSYIFDWPFWIY